ncbi:MAG: clan AA aspartic protease [Betaproteobacteria bacterium]|nr:clan AA aspartic protease [Betaproteobacteria bacterium]
MKIKHALILTLCAIANAAGAASEPLAVVPFKLDGKEMLVEVSIDGSDPVTFVVDTGASHTVFDPTLARKLGLEVKPAPPTTGTGTGDVEKSITKPVRMTMNGFSAELPEPWVIDLSKAALPAGAIGLVGAEIFKSHVVRIDPVASKLSVFDPASYRHEAKAESIPLIVEGDKLFLEATLEVPAGKSVTHKLRIDTGSESSINDEVAQQSEEVRTSTLGGGLGDNFKSYAGVFTSAKIGPFTFKKFWGPGGPRPAIGMELLRRFVLTFDAPHGRLYLDPTEQLNEPVPTPPPSP